MVPSLKTKITCRTCGTKFIDNAMVRIQWSIIAWQSLSQRFLKLAPQVSHLSALGLVSTALRGVLSSDVGFEDSAGDDRGLDRMGVGIGCVSVLELG